MTDSTQTPDVPLLDAVQARLLGCLVEKEATTPDTYPLTVNAAQSAANQKTAREPVMNVDAGSVQHALRQLEALGLARQHFSSRADRYEHRLQAALDLTRQQTVLLALLLLRGPQTLGELVTRSERLHRFADTDEARHAIDRLQQRALLVVLPRASGQREDRYMHLLCGEVGRRGAGGEVRQQRRWHAAIAADPGLAERVAQLEAAVAELQAQLAELRG
ncbi:DUF480 domain-containing protein [Stenotrophomonas maltophilia]|nr:DUF480 domain-containing protein [Stenotrophomonas maltophilia]